MFHPSLLTVTLTLSLVQLPGDQLPTPMTLVPLHLLNTHLCFRCGCPHLASGISLGSLSGVPLWSPSLGFLSGVPHTVTLLGIHLL